MNLGNGVCILSWMVVRFLSPGPVEFISLGRRKRIIETVQSTLASHCSVYPHSSEMDLQPPTKAPKTGEVRIHSWQVYNKPYL